METKRDKLPGPSLDRDKISIRRRISKILICPGPGFALQHFFICVSVRDLFQAQFSIPVRSRKNFGPIRLSRPVPSIVFLLIFGSERHS